MFTRDEELALTGALRISSAKGVTRHLGVDTGVIETPYSEDAYERTAPGCGIVLYRDGQPHFNGLVGSERTMGWDAEQGRPTIKVQLLGDNVHLADRIAYPDPARAGDDQTTFDYWTPRDGTGAAVNVPGSTAMWRLINQQLGPSARAERKVTGLTMGVDPAVGTVRRYEALFQDCMFCLQVFSVASGLDLGVRVTPSGGGLVASIYQPNDSAADVRFSADLSNLVGFGYTETAPDVTYALVPGQGDLHLRARRAATATNPLDTRWGRRIEKVFDRRDEADTTKLQQAADDAIAEGRGQVDLSVTLTDSQAATYGTDWGLGDKVTVYVGLAGQAKAATVVDVVREIAFEVGSDGAETLTPAIGTPDAKAMKPGPSQQALAEIGRRLENYITRK